jgi:hypothetical protein
MRLVLTALGGTLGVSGGLWGGWRRAAVVSSNYGHNWDALCVGLLWQEVQMIERAARW